MASASIDVLVVKKVVNDLLDRLIEDLHITAVQIDESQELYWDYVGLDLFDVSKEPSPSVGRLSDDMDLIANVGRNDTAYNLVHVAPLLRYLAEKIKQ
jgi:hypothetical protein